jgi:hypothetical protein
MLPSNPLEFLFECTPSFERFLIYLLDSTMMRNAQLATLETSDLI